MSPWVNAKAKIGKFLFKCHGRKPVGIYSSIDLVSIVKDLFLLAFKHTK